QQAAAENMLSGALRQLFALAEANPALPGGFVRVDFRLRSEDILRSRRRARNRRRSAVREILGRARAVIPDGRLWSLQPHPIQPAPLDSAPNRAVLSDLLAGLCRRAGGGRAVV